MNAIAVPKSILEGEIQDLQEVNAVLEQNGKRDDYYMAGIQARHVSNELFHEALWSNNADFPEKRTLVVQALQRTFDLFQKQPRETEDPQQRMEEETLTEFRSVISKILERAKHMTPENVLSE